MDEYDVVLGSSMGRGAPMGHCVWEFTGETWELKKNQAENGGVPGPKPVQAGQFKGQLRATPCIAG